MKFLQLEDGMKIILLPYSKNKVIEEKRLIVYNRSYYLNDITNVYYSKLNNNNSNINSIVRYVTKCEYKGDIYNIILPRRIYKKFSDMGQQYFDIYNYMYEIDIKINDVYTNGYFFKDYKNTQINKLNSDYTIPLSELVNTSDYNIGVSYKLLSKQNYLIKHMIYHGLLEKSDFKHVYREDKINKILNNIT